VLYIELANADQALNVQLLTPAAPPPQVRSLNAALVNGFARADEFVTVLLPDHEHDDFVISKLGEVL
jgi:hypothetical protein